MFPPRSRTRRGHNAAAHIADADLRPSNSTRQLVRKAVLCSALALAFASASAQAQSNSAASDARVQRYDIPGGSLGAALNRAAQEGGVNLTYDRADAAGKNTAGLRGDYSFTGALSVLLQGSGLSAVAAGADGYRLVRAPNAVPASTSDAMPARPAAAGAGVATLGAITVTGTNSIDPAEGQAFVAYRTTGGMKSNASLLESPQSISVITAERIKAQGAQSVNEALRYTSGVRTESSGAQKMDDNLYVRGFLQGSQDIYQDGLRVVTPGYFGFYAGETYGVDRVEVLKGPSSVLYGQQSPGGLINLVSKRPSAEPIREIELSAGSFERFQGAFDIGGANEDKTFMYRLVGVARDADTQVDYVKDNRVYLAPSFTWRPDASTQLTVLTAYQKNEGSYYAQVPANAVLTRNAFGHIPFSRFLGEPAWENETTERTTIGYEFSHRFNDHIRVEQNFRYTDFDNHRQYLQANGALVNQRLLNRRYTLRDIQGEGVTIDNRIGMDFDTGPFSHKALVGVDYLWGKSLWSEQGGNAAAIDIFNPVYGSTVNTSVFTSRSVQDIRASQAGLYLQDQVKYGKWLTTAGVRKDWAWRDTKNVSTGSTSSQDDSAFTWRGGLTYLSDSGFAPYVSYSKSFAPVIGSDRLGNPYLPERGKQVEAGIKYQPAGYDSFITASVFDLARQNVQTIDPVNSNFSVQTGEVRVRGVELEGVASLGDGLSLTAAYTYNDAEVTKTNTAAQLGKRPTRVPVHAASLWLNYDFQMAALDGLSVGSGVRYVGETMGDDNNTFKVPGFALVDAAIRYDFGKRFPGARGLTASVNFSNLFDKYYVPACFTANACNYGASRTVIGKVTYRW